MRVTPPTVNVLALCYNHEPFAVECLESIARQSFASFELLIIDDCSQDRSAEVIRAWLRETGYPARFIAHGRNVGVCASLNEAVSLCGGKYFAYVSTDDVWSTDKLLVQVEEMESLPERVAVLYSDALMVDQDGNAIGSHLESRGRLDDPPSGDVFCRLVERNWIPVAGTLMRRQVFEEVGGYDESLSYEDLDMWLRIAREHEFRFSPFVSASRRVHGASTAHLTGPLMRDDHFEIYLKHVGTGAPCQTLLWQKVRRLVTRIDMDRDRTRRYARASLRAAPGPRSFTLHALARAGVPLDVMRRAGALLTPRKPPTRVADDPAAP